MSTSRISPLISIFLVPIAAFVFGCFVGPKLFPPAAPPEKSATPSRSEPKIDEKPATRPAPLVQVLPQPAAPAAPAGSPELVAPANSAFAKVLSVSKASETLLEKTRARHVDQYVNLFAELGVPEEQRLALFDQYIALFKEQLFSLNQLQALYDQQQKFRQDLRSALGEKYPVFEEFETRRVAEEEFKSILRFAGPEKTPDLEAQRAQLVELLRSSEAYSLNTAISVTSPFQPIPVPFGSDTAARDLGNMRAILEKRSNTFLQSSAAALPPQTQTLLREYFATALSRYDSMMRGPANRAK